jgi:hypothetical protein
MNFFITPSYSTLLSITAVTDTICPLFRTLWILEYPMDPSGFEPEASCLQGRRSSRTELRALNVRYVTCISMIEHIAAFW